MKLRKSIILSLFLGLTLLLSGCTWNTNSSSQTNTINKEVQTFDLNSIPEYSGSPYVEINNNKPFFTKEDLTTKSF